MRTVTLWHGTTRSAAVGIVKGGWQPSDSGRVVDTVALQHGLDPAELRAVLSAWGRFVLVEHNRDRSAWFAASEAAANRWAQRAPEARWEALWAAWLLQCGRTDPWQDPPYTPWGDPEAAGWHVRQFLDDPPAVITLDVPVDRLQDHNQKPVAPDHLDARLHLIAEGLTAQVSVALPVPADWVTDLTVVERQIPFTAAAGLFGTSIEDLTAQVKRGDVPEPRPGEPLRDSYWPWSELAPLLPESRNRRELDE